MGVRPDPPDDAPTALHTAARRFCWDGVAARLVADLPAEFAHLATRVRDPFTCALAWEEVRRHEAQLWGEILEYGTAGEYPPFVQERAAMFGAILDEVERASAGDLSSWEGARAFLLEAGRRARPIGTIYGGSPPYGTVSAGEPPRGDDPRWDPEQRAAAEAARAAYLEYVETPGAPGASFAAAALRMPHRRVLHDDEVDEIRAASIRRWDADPTRGFWHPLRDAHWPPEILVVDDESFLIQFGARRLQPILLAHGVDRVWEIDQLWPVRPARETETGACGFVGIESTWSSGAVDWLVYASHEDSVAIAGDWLVAAVKAAWPTWEEAGYEHVLRRYHEQRARFEEEMRRARQDDRPEAQ